MSSLDGRSTCITANDIDICGLGIGQLIFCFLAGAWFWKGYSDSEGVFSFRDLEKVTKLDGSNVAFGPNDIQFWHHDLESAL